MSRFTVVLDACVRYPAPLRDFLLELAARGLFRARWSDMIHAEWMRNVLRDRPDLTPDRLTRTRLLMDAHAEDCLVTGFEALIPALNLPDANDCHVMAAAIHAHADAVVTFNLRDFPANCLAPYNLTSIHPDDFISQQMDLDEAAVITAAQRCRLRLKNPRRTAEDYLSTLEKQGLPKAVGAMRPFAALI